LPEVPGSQEEGSWREEQGAGSREVGRWGTLVPEQEAVGSLVWVEGIRNIGEGSQKAEEGSKKTEEGSQKAEEGSQKLVVGTQMEVEDTMQLVVDSQELAEGSRLVVVVDTQQQGPPGTEGRVEPPGPQAGAPAAPRTGAGGRWRISSPPSPPPSSLRPSQSRGSPPWPAPYRRAHGPSGSPSVPR